MEQNRINKAQWRELIANYISYCNNRGKLGLLVKTDMKIRGIGAQSMIETARQVAYKYDIPLDDSCWRVVVRKSPIIKLLGVPARDIKSYCARLSSDFGQLTSQQKIDFIIAYQNKIRRLLKK